MPRFLRTGRRFAAAVLAVAAAGSTLAAVRAEDPATAPSKPAPAPTPLRTGGGGKAEGQQTVSVPVRLADAPVAQLLHTDDRVDVFAVTATHERARLVARCGRVALVPKSGETVPSDGGLVVLTVPRRTAIVLAGASATSRLGVALC